jgi:hypothetical protein
MDGGRGLSGAFTRAVSGITEAWGEEKGGRVLPVNGGWGAEKVPCRSSAPIRCLDRSRSGVTPATDRPTGLRRPFERKVERELIRPGIGNARIGGADEMPQIVEVKNCRYADCGAAVVSSGIGSLAKNFHA